MGTYTAGEENWAYQWLGMLDPGNSYRKYDYWFKKMSYMRINSIRLGYTFPERLLGHIGFSSARFSFEARNPFVFGSSWEYLYPAVGEDLFLWNRFDILTLNIKI